MPQAHHSIQSVARRTGLTPHVIRIWERRYGAVTPSRTDTNRRLYSDEEVSRLELLRRATEGGHSIGAIARLSTAELQALAGSAAPAGATESPEKPHGYIDRCMAAIQAFDGSEFEQVLTEATLKLGQHGALEQVIAPVAQAIGDFWRDGQITAAHEHFASAAIRSFLAHASRPFALPAEAPVLIVATPAGQLHELGAVMVAAAATDLGWRVIYLGTSLPALEIAGSALQNRARAVALSIVYPADDEHLPGELVKLRKHLPPHAKVIVGGRASAAYGETLKEIGALRSADLREFCRALENIRASNLSAS